MTDVTGRKRQSKGTPTGGQFAAENRSESGIELNDEAAHDYRPYPRGARYPTKDDIVSHVSGGGARERLGDQIVADTDMGSVRGRTIMRGNTLLVKDDHTGEEHELHSPRNNNLVPHGVYAIHYVEPSSARVPETILNETHDALGPYASNQDRRDYFNAMVTSGDNEAAWEDHSRTMSHTQEVRDINHAASYLEKSSDVSDQKLASRLYEIADSSPTYMHAENHEGYRESVDQARDVLANKYTTEVKDGYHYEMLPALAKAESSELRYAIASRTDTPPHTLRELSEDENEDVARMAKLMANRPALRYAK